MKHPALARVFSIVLALLSLIMLVNGSLGFSKAAAALQDSLDKYQRLEDKTTDYESLTAQLENTISYDEAYAALEAMQTEHDSDAAQHRTDLATHTATMGGYTMAVQVINDTKAELTDTKAELAEGKAELEAQEKQFNQASAEFEAQKPMLEEAIATSQQGAQYFTAASANADSAMGKIEAAQSTRPSEPEALAEGATDEDKAKYEAAMEQYATYYAAWELGVKQDIAPDLVSMASNAQQGAAIMSALPEEMGGGTSMDMTGFDVSNMSVDEIYVSLGQMKAGFDQAAATPVALQASLDSAQAQITAGAQAIATAKYQIAAGEAAIEKGEQELQHQLELLWYNMGQLEDETADLESTKQRLDSEADVIAKQLVSVEEQKELEQKQSSARIILMKEEGIKTLVNAGGDLADSAKAYIESGREAAQTRYSRSFLLSILAVVSGGLGALSIFGSFEIIKGRAALLIPTALCLAGSVAAELLNYSLNSAQMYTATFVIIAAVLHMMFIIPKNKKAV